jgi:alpha-aminoadipic semialdehyde synthase
VPISNSLRLEGIANRDSSSYGPVYDLPSDIRTLLRGTLRYPGYSELVQSFKDIGFLSNIPLSQALESWDHLLPRCLSASGFAVRDSDYESARSALIDVIGAERTALLLDALQWLGLVPSKTPVARPSVLAGPAAPIDHLTNLLAHQLRYGPQERDLVLLSHEVIARPVHAPIGTQEEIHTSQLITYGTPSASAMSRTVGLPVAFATLQILDGEVTARGVQGP